MGCSGATMKVPVLEKRLIVLLLFITVLLAGLLVTRRQSEPHHVLLTWHQPAPTLGIRIVGYNIYRHASEGSQFVRIATHIPGPPYKDRMISPGRTYFYVVTSIDQFGRESRYSSQVIVEVH